MMHEPVILTYTGTAPGADANTYVIFDSTVAFPGGAMHVMAGNSRYELSLKNAAAGTLRLRASNDRGVNWVQVRADLAVAASAASADANFLDWLVQEYKDFQVLWVNGGAAQTTWVVFQSLSPSPAPTTP